MYSYGPPQMAGQKQGDQLEHTYNSYVRIRDVALKTCRRWWTIGRSEERRSGISALTAGRDDDDDDDDDIFICAFLNFCSLVLVGFLLLSKDAFFMSSCFCTPRERNILLLIWLVFTQKVPLSGWWRNFHPLRLKNFFQMCRVENQTCFFFYSYWIDILYMQNAETKLGIFKYNNERLYYKITLF